MEQNDSPLVEGVDYYVDRGQFVFTAAYHLKRGHCCDSGCRHCPYVEGDLNYQGTETPRKTDDAGCS